MRERFPGRALASRDGASWGGKTRLPEEALTLAEVLQAAGYATAGFAGGGQMDGVFGLDQGFDTYVETWKQELEGFDGDPNGAEAVNLHVRRILDGMDDSKPFFLWVHYLDPHFPYVPPAEWADHFQDDEWFEPIRTIEIDQEKAKQQVTGIGHGQVLDGRDDLGFYIARYDAEIAYTDRVIIQRAGDVIPEVVRSLPLPQRSQLAEAMDDERLADVLERRMELCYRPYHAQVERLAQQRRRQPDRHSRRS